MKYLLTFLYFYRIKAGEFINTGKTFEEVLNRRVLHRTCLSVRQVLSCGKCLTTSQSSVNRFNSLCLS